MRVDCYNASEICIAYVTVGDTFYSDSRLYIKVDLSAAVGGVAHKVYAVDLSTGYVHSFDDTETVILADTKVVVNA